MDTKYLQFLNATQKETVNKQKIENFNPYTFVNNTNYKVGQIIKHTLFGTGTIKAVDEKSLTVDFVSGQKKIALALADKFFVKWEDLK